MPTRVRDRMIGANASIIRVDPQLWRSMEQRPITTAPCSGFSWVRPGKRRPNPAPQIGSHPEAMGPLPPGGLSHFEVSAGGWHPREATPATAVKPLPPARDGAATAPMSYLGLPLGAEARQLVSKSPNWDAGGPGTGSHNERQSARAV